MNAENFKIWLIKYENKKPTTANSYVSAIHKIAEHLTGIRNIKVDLYKMQDGNDLVKIVDSYQIKGRYSAFGDTGHGTYRNALKAYYRYFNNTPKRSKSRKITNGEDMIEIDNVGINYFDKELMSEANQMGEYYKLIYCLERSIRKLVVKVMEDNYGANWWNDKIDVKINENVDFKIRIEKESAHSKNSENKIDYTTFTELRRIVKSNWIVFSSEFRSLKAFNSITEKLNILRNSIAHSTPFPKDEITRLKLTINDWFRLVN